MNIPGRKSKFSPPRLALPFSNFTAAGKNGPKGKQIFNSRNHIRRFRGSVWSPVYAGFLARGEVEAPFSAQQDAFMLHHGQGELDTGFGPRWHHISYFVAFALLFRFLHAARHTSYISHVMKVWFTKAAFMPKMPSSWTSRY
jgi:hypothetical protein